MKLLLQDSSLLATSALEKTKWGFGLWRKEIGYSPIENSAGNQYKMTKAIWLLMTIWVKLAVKIYNRAVFLLSVKNININKKG